MTTREDVLLQIGEVRYKKGDGTLYIMNERLAWIAENRDTVLVSHKYCDIKMQKISPEGKPKVQLQVVLHDGNSSTFHFVNKQGQQAMLEDRDKVKEILQQLLPNFKRKVDKELEEKNRILSENQNLLQLYRDLVITQVITSDEFWNMYAKDYLNKTEDQEQESGVSAAFLAEIKPQADGCNGLKYNLNNDIINSIFKTYPSVKKKYGEYVPSKLSGNEFWTKFFQSHYFHRDRLTAGTKDIFSECGKIDEQILKAEIRNGPDDPLLNLKEFDDVTLGEGFSGTSYDTTNSGNIVHQSMIKRFNQHSIGVLKTNGSAISETGNGPLNKSNSKKSSKNENSNGDAEPSTSNPDNENGSANKKDGNQDDSQIPIKRQKIIEKIRFEDLGEPIIESELANAAAGTSGVGDNFRIAMPERYLQGPAVNAPPDNQGDQRQLEEVHYYLLNSTATWDQPRPSAQRVVINPASAVNALGELSPGGTLMRGFQDQSVAQLVPPDFEKDLRGLYLALTKILKNFWTCFPPTSEIMEEKIVSSYEVLQRFKEAKLEPFEKRALRELSPLAASLTQHLNRMLAAAKTKYATHQERKMRQNR